MPDLDSRSKRASSMRLFLPCVLALPLADGAIDQADRQHTVGDYSGILATASMAIYDTKSFDATSVPSESRIGTYLITRDLDGTFVVHTSEIGTSEMVRDVVGTLVSSKAFVGTVGQ